MSAVGALGLGVGECVNALPRPWVVSVGGARVLGWAVFLVALPVSPPRPQLHPPRVESEGPLGPAGA